jgi:hypothetical protein
MFLIPRRPELRSESATRLKATPKNHIVRYGMAERRAF